MTTLTRIASALAVAGLVLSPIAIATTADAARMSKEEKAAMKAKNTECKAKAKEQKLHLGKRSAFIKECMKG